jgi:2-aminoadipate transaminase
MWLTWFSAEDFMTTTASRRLNELFTERAQQVESQMHWPNQPKRITFSYGFADPELFPREQLVAAADAVLADDIDGALNYGPSYAGLRTVVADRLRRHGVEADEENILLTYGSGQAIGLLPYVFVNPGDTVIIEGPTFMGAVMEFRAAGAQIVTAPVDASGLNVDMLEETLRDLRRQHIRPKFIYTIPTFQNPSGTTLPLERRQRLVALAEEYGVVVVEDDAYGDLRFEGEALPSLAALDQSGWVLNLGTFSKILAPGIRQGWAYGSPEIIRRLEMFKVEGSSGPFMTRLVARFSANGQLERHIAALCAHYHHKRDVMLAAIQQHFPQEVRYVVPQGGFFFWCELPQGMSATALQQRAEQLGATFTCGTRCFADGQGDNAIRLAFSYLPVEQIERGIAMIGAAMQSVERRS